MEKIDAINEVLSILGEEEINSIDEMSFEAQSVDKIIDRVSREVCMDGEPFNLVPFSLKPNSNGEIVLSNLVLNIDVDDSDGSYRIIKDEGFYKIKDFIKNTFKIGKTLTGEMKINFPFEDLDPVIQNYIIKKVCLKKIATDLGNKDLINLANNDLDIALTEYVRHSLSIYNVNLNDNEYTRSFDRYYNIINN